MKIMFICMSMGKGGAERVIMSLANELSGKNDISIVTLMNCEDAYKLNPTVKRVRVDKAGHNGGFRLKKLFKKISLVRQRRLRKIIMAEKPDTVIAFLPEPSLRLMLAGKLSPKIRTIPTIVSVRNDPKQEYKNPLIRFLAKRLYKNVGGMVYQTEDAKNYFDGIIKTKNQVIISNPIHRSILVEPKSDAVRKDVIVSVGRLEPQKNQELLIKAFCGISDAERHGYILEIYGEGALRGPLEKLIGELGAEKKVFLKGRTDDVAQKLNNSKIFVFSSLYEGLPNALLEAMATGLPCISTDCPCGGPRSLIENGKNGLLVENNNEKDLREAICRLINDVDLRKKIAKNALAIRKSNDIMVIVDKWKDIISRVVGVCSE